jgi:hypothetical protein
VKNIGRIGKIQENEEGDNFFCLKYNYHENTEHLLIANKGIDVEISK